MKVLARVSALLLLLTATFFSGCLFSAGETPPEPSPPQPEPVQIGTRVYRGDMGALHGLLFFSGKGSNMTVVYDTVRCGLVYAWKGPVLGPLRDPDGGYVPQGKVYEERREPGFWTVLVGGQTVAAKIRFAGFTEDSAGSLALHYALDLPDGRTVKIEEDPVHDDHYGDHALFRNITCEGLDTTITLRVSLGGLHPNWDELWSQSASGTLESWPDRHTLVLTYDGISVVKTTWIGSGDI